MGNSKISLSFGIAAITFLVIFYILITDFNSKRIADFHDYTATVANIVKQKNNKIKILAHQLMMEQKQNEDLKNTLANARNALDALSKKLAQPVPTVPASVPVPTAVTK